MPTITVFTREGDAHEIDATASVSVMETIREAGIDELLAICGGCCSCATCHVYVEAGGEDFPPMSSDEDDLLDSSGNRTRQSRLSCQLVLTEASSGLQVRIAPDD